MLGRQRGRAKGGFGGRCRGILVVVIPGKVSRIAIRVREYAAADGAACAQLYLESRRVAFSWAPEGAFRLQDFEPDTEGEAVWVAELEGKVVGFISLWLPDSFVHNLFVAPPAQNLGVGSLLLKTAEEQLPAPLALKCQVQNRHACGFYARRGWREVERGQADLGEYIVFRR